MKREKERIKGNEREKEEVENERGKEKWQRGERVKERRKKLMEGWMEKVEDRVFINNI